MDISNKVNRSGFILLPAALLFLADQVFKRTAEAHLPLLNRYPILGQNWITYSRVHNLGLIGDRFSNIPKGYIEPYTHYFPLGCLLALIVIYLIRFKAASDSEHVFSTLLVAGGLSNLWDHWRENLVVDTFQVYIRHDFYLPFNLADVGILIGSLFLAITMTRQLKYSPTK